MCQKLKTLLILFLGWGIFSIADAQSIPLPPGTIAVDVVDSASVSANSAGHIPIIDLLNESVSVEGISLIYPSEPVSDLYDELISNPSSEPEIFVQMPFETYIQGVVRTELDSALTEASKAEAVAARCFAAGEQIPYGFSRVK